MTAIADSNNGGRFTSGLTAADSPNAISWSDTITFRTTNPNGSDFRLGLALHDTINLSTSSVGGFVAGSAFAGLSSGPAGIFGPLLLALQDGVSRNSTGDIINHPPSDNVQTVLHMQNFSTLILTGWLRSRVKASDTVGSVTLNAADTALFALSSNDPLASYTTASGTVFASSVPEPATSALALAGLGLVGWQARRRRAAAAD